MHSAPRNRVCEDHLTFDLAKLGTLKPGAHRRLPHLHATDWEWQPWVNGGYVLDLAHRWASAIITRTADGLRISISASSKTRTVERSVHHVEIVEAPNTIAGTRLWFRCPCCARNVRTVYFRHNTIGCRTCADLKHRSTVTFKTQRWEQRRDEILHLLGGTLSRRPRYMRRKRYTALLLEYEGLHRKLKPTTEPQPMRKLNGRLLWSPTPL
ncbi:hypothetical protein [Hyphomicrobium sp. CS1GBMeth3]|uniref:hypothetical protein n=1 Tax=Hyphomicrobium sp. CS1GBMeth3 TaxID=1892845 RepID=UPI000931A95D|nr:hypothetical protein [Hyphomicrobium sp. CS1GBMeth3]